MLTEAQAWRKIARRIVERKWRTRGLCFEAYRLYNGEVGGISGATYIRMTDRIDENLRVHPDTTEDGHAYPPGEEPEARVLAALWLALEAEEE